MSNWNGHAPATSGVLLDLLTTAHTGRTLFSIAQRALFTACEFWAATKNRTLLDHLGSDAESQLRAAEESFDLIGLKWAPRILERTRMQLEVDSPASLVRIAEDLEDVLNALDEPVDSAIASFASLQVSTA